MLDPDDSEIDAEGQRVLARRMAQYSAEALQRIVGIDEAIVIHTAFSEGLTALDRIFQLGTMLTTPFGVRIIGPQGSGKTTLIRYFCESLPKGTLFSQTDVVCIRLRQRPTLGHAVESVLTSLRYPFPKVRLEAIGPKRTASIDALKQKRARLLIVDEAHNLCARQTAWKDGSDEGSYVTEYFREIMDAKIGLALMGGTSLEDLGNRDKYLLSRCKSIMHLTDFAFHGSWVALLKGICAQSRTHNLDFLLSGDQPFRLHRATGGNLRSLKQLLIEAVLIATDRGARDLEAGDLRLGFDRALRGGGISVNTWAV